MLRKVGIWAFVLSFSLSAWLPSYLVFSAPNEEDLAPDARSAILMDADSGTILSEKNSHQKLPPASVTKSAS